VFEVVEAKDMGEHKVLMGRTWDGMSSCLNEIDSGLVKLLLWEGLKVVAGGLVAEANGGLLDRFGGD
jgi:hypothetical protein